MSDLYPYLLSFLLLLAACVGGEEHSGDDIDPTPSGEKIAVSFSSTIDLATKAGTAEGGAVTDQALADGVQVIVYAYKQDAVGNPAAAPVVSRTYQATNGNGSLTESGDKGMMYLSAGKYSFYALSTNDATTPPMLADGSYLSTGELANNTDYIYCATNTAITSLPGETQSVSLSFSHLSMRIELKVACESSGTGRVTAAETPVIKLAATNPSGSKIELGANPAIAPGVPVTGESNYSAMHVEGNLSAGFTADYILLPIQKKQEIPVTITFPSITIEGLPAQTNKLYTLTVTPPDDEFVSGNQYSYKVNITGNEAVFKEVTVTDWTGKDGSMPDSDITEDFEDVKQEQP